jgi:Lipase (class 3)
LDITEGCNVLKGFYVAYDGIGKENIYQFVDTCMGSSSSTSSTASSSIGRKQLVLTGHSQGGATAEVASIEMSDYNPLVITFGSPVFQKSNNQGYTSCSLIQPEHIWRFINTETIKNRLHYDPVRWIEEIIHCFFVLLVVSGYSVVSENKQTKIVLLVPCTLLTHNTNRIVCLFLFLKTNITVLWIVPIDAIP